MLKGTHPLLNFLDLTYFNIILFFTVFSLIIFLTVKIINKIWQRQLKQRIEYNNFETKRINNCLITIIKPLPLKYIGISLMVLKKKHPSSQFNELDRINILANMLVDKTASKVFFITHKLRSGRIINLLGFITFSKTKRQLITKSINYCNIISNLLDTVGIELDKSINLIDYFNHLLRDFLMINLIPKKAVRISLSVNRIRDIYSSLILLIENTFVQFSNDILFIMVFSNYKKTKTSLDTKTNKSSKNEDEFGYSIGIDISYGVLLKHTLIKNRFSLKTFKAINKLEISLRSLINPLLSYSINEEHTNFTQHIKVNNFIEFLLCKPVIIVRTSSDRLIKILITKAVDIFNALNRVHISVPQLSIIDEFASGDFFIGYQLDNDKETIPFKLRLEDIKRHIVITGPSGKGKTRLARIILEELIKKYSDKIKIWIFDFHGEYLDLALTHNFLIMVPGHEKTPLGINLFDPLNENPDTYVSFILRIFEEALRNTENPFSPQMERIISIAINETILRKNNRSPKTFIMNLWKWSNELINEIPSALQSFHAIISRIRTLFTGLIGRIFWVEKSNINPQELIRHNIIFDLSFLTRHGTLKRDLMILINIILRYVVNEITKKGYQDTDISRVFLIIEEGRYLVPWKKKDDYSNTSTLEDIAILARKYGITLCTISQSPASISQEILENAGTFFLLGGEPPSIESSLYQGKVEQYMHVMPPRECIVRTTSHPALIRIRIRPITVMRINKDQYNAFLEKSTSHLKKNYCSIFPPFEEFVKSLLTGDINSHNANHIEDAESSENFEIKIQRSKAEIHNLLYKPYNYLLNLIDKMRLDPIEISETYIKKLISVINRDMKEYFNKRQLLEITHNLKLISMKIKNNKD